MVSSLRYSETNGVLVCQRQPLPESESDNDDVTSLSARLSRNPQAEESKWPRATQLVYDKNQIKLLEQQQSVQNVLRASIFAVEGAVLFLFAFPDSESKEQILRDLILESATRKKEPRIFDRLKEDSTYLYVFYKLVRFLFI